MFTLPYYSFNLIKGITLLLICIIFSNLIYFTVLSLFGLVRPKRDYKMYPPTKNFLFVVPAHNEEYVIGPTVESILNQNYPQRLFDLVVIADNCTDQTAKIVSKYSRVKLFENTSTPDEPRGKPHAIGKYVKTDRWRNYDYIVFIDADNIVDSNYLLEMNNQLMEYPEFTVVQGYLGIKNVRTSITATGYAAVYFITNRAVQYANYLLGWNAAIGGTGFVLNTNYLIEHGWNPKSYTEDFELQVELSINGKRSGWNHFAVVYDEKPDSFKISNKQRTRWAQGHWFVAFSTTRRQIFSLFNSLSIREFFSKLETLFYSYSMVRPVAFSVILIFSILDIRILTFLPQLFSLMIFWLGIEIFNFFIIPIVYFPQEAKSYFLDEVNILKKILFFIRLVIAFVWNSLTYMIAQVWGFCTWFRPQNNWVKTVHTVTFDREVT